MTRPRFPQTLIYLTVLVAIALAISGGPASGQGAPSRQVTMFGILATPGGNQVDPKLQKIEPQLRKLFPNHSFKLLAVESKRLTVGQSIKVEMPDGWVAGTELTSVLDNEGNVQFKFALDLNQQTEFATFVKTPPNQLFFCDKMLPNQSRLLVGLGGR